MQPTYRASGPSISSPLQNPKLGREPPVLVPASYTYMNIFLTPPQTPAPGFSSQQKPMSGPMVQALNRVGTEAPNTAAGSGKLIFWGQKACLLLPRAAGATTGAATAAVVLSAQWVRRAVDRQAAEESTAGPEPQNPYRRYWHYVRHPALQSQSNQSGRIDSMVETMPPGAAAYFSAALSCHWRLLGLAASARSQA